MNAPGIPTAPQKACFGVEIVIMLFVGAPLDFPIVEQAPRTICFEPTVFVCMLLFVLVVSRHPLRLARGELF